MKLKEWLNKCDDEGLSNGDAIFMFIWNLSALIVPVILYKILN